MNDTPSQIADLVRSRLMARSGSERIRMGSRMFDAARRMVLASLPDGLTDAERKELLFQRIYGRSLPDFGNVPERFELPERPGLG